MRPDCRAVVLNCSGRLSGRPDYRTVEDNCSTIPLELHGDLAPVAGAERSINDNINGVADEAHTPVG